MLYGFEPHRKVVDASLCESVSSKTRCDKQRTGVETYQNAA